MFSVQGSTACVWHTIVLVVGLFVVLVSQPRSVFVLTPFLSQYLHNLVKWWNSIYVQASGSMMCKPSLRHAGVLQVPESWLGNGEVVCLPFVLIYVCLDKATCLFVYASVKLRSLKTSWQKKKISLPALLEIWHSYDCLQTAWCCTFSPAFQLCFGYVLFGSS